MATELNDFSTKIIMEADGWTFNCNDKHVFSPGVEYCKDVPTTSYCGFCRTGNGTISYTFSNAGKAKLIYGQSWDKGSINVKKNNMVIDIRGTRGTSTASFDYASGDVLKIEGIGDSVINIHNITLTPRGK